MDDDTPTARTAPHRIRIHGTSGSGKTTLAREVAARTGLTRIELDEVFWDAGWTVKDAEVGLALLRARLAAAETTGWVADGSWQSTVGDVLDGADVVVCLDLPRHVVMWRVLTRTVVRGATRRELWQGNRETLRSLVRRDPEDNIVLWAWTTWRASHEAWAELERTGHPGGPVVRLRSRREVRAWLESL